MFIGLAIGLMTASIWLALVLVVFDREVARYEGLQGCED
jgi:hypothetical protein